MLSQSSEWVTAGSSELQRTFAIPEISVARSLVSFVPSHVARCSLGCRTKRISRWAGSLAEGASTSTLSSCSMPLAQKRSPAGWIFSVPSPVVGRMSAAWSTATEPAGSCCTSRRRLAMNRAGSIGAWRMHNS